MPTLGKNLMRQLLSVLSIELEWYMNWEINCYKLSTTDKEIEEIIEIIDRDGDYIQR